MMNRYTIRITGVPEELTSRTQGRSTTQGYNEQYSLKLVEGIKGFKKTYKP